MLRQIFFIFHLLYCLSYSYSFQSLICVFRPCNSSYVVLPIISSLVFLLISLLILISPCLPPAAFFFLSSWQLFSRSAQTAISLHLFSFSRIFSLMSFLWKIAVSHFDFDYVPRVISPSDVLLPARSADLLGIRIRVDFWIRWARSAVGRPLPFPIPTNSMLLLLVC